MKLNNVVDHMRTSFRAWTKSLPSLVTRWAAGLCNYSFNVTWLCRRGHRSCAARRRFHDFTLVLKANFPAINPFLLHQPVMMSFEQFQYAFVNTLPLEEQRAPMTAMLSLNRARSDLIARCGGQSGFNKRAVRF